MFVPNLICWVSKQSVTGHNLYGEVPAATPVRERCAIVKLRSNSQHTTVRADSSASRGHGDEFITENKILLSANTIAALNDKVEVAGVSIRVTSLFPRHDVSGRLDHYEMTGELWA